jgi:hypothetical protein
LPLAKEALGRGLVCVGRGRDDKTEDDDAAADHLRGPNSGFNGANGDGAGATTDGTTVAETLTIEGATTAGGGGGFACATAIVDAEGLGDGAGAM